MKKIIKMKNFTIGIAMAILAVGFWGCEKYDHLNPNVANEDALVSSGQILARLQYELYQGGGHYDNMPDRYIESPFADPLMKWNQYFVSNDIYYGGDNQYFWSSSASNYNIIKNCNSMEKTAFATTATNLNPYYALSRFFKAYSYIWMTQRVGDMPMTDAGKGGINETPAFDKQKDIYIKCLELLDSANYELGLIITENKLKITNDIYFVNNLTNWRKVINTYRLRVLVSLSKRVDDTPELNVKAQFDSIVNNSARFPIMASNDDNLKFTFYTTYNPYPRSPTSYYNDRLNVSTTLLDLLVPNKDPRTFMIAVPAPKHVDTTKSKGGLGKKVKDFTAYVGANYALSFGELKTNKDNGEYSFINYLRYYKTTTGPASTYGDESKGAIIIGYPEMCFNIAEGLNRGWATGDAGAWYKKGIEASMKFFGIADGTKITIADKGGKVDNPDPNDATKKIPLIGTGSVTIGKDCDSLNYFYKYKGIAYNTNNKDSALMQIVNQKYIAMWQNSGWEAYYNWRRTGLPNTFVTTGAGINPVQKIPRRFQYPTNEAKYNATNYQKAIADQFGGEDDLYKDTWLTK